MDEEFTIDKIDWKTYLIIFLTILIFITYFATSKITKDKIIKEIYDEMDKQYIACANSCGNLLEPAWINIRHGIAECICLNIIYNGNQTDNRLSTGDN